MRQNEPELEERRGPGTGDYRIARHLKAELAAVEALAVVVPQHLVA